MPLTSPVQTDGSTDTALQEASRQLGVPYIRLTSRTIPPEVLQRVPVSVATQSQMVPYEESQLPSGRRVLRLAVADPKLLREEAPKVISDLHLKDGLVIEVALTGPQDIQYVLRQYATGEEIGETKEPSDTKSTSVTSQPSAIPMVDLLKQVIPRDVLERIPEETARKYRIVVFKVLDQGRTIHAALEDPNNPQVKELISFLSGQNNLKIVLHRATKASIDAALEQYTESSKADKSSASATKPIPPAHVAKDVDSKSSSLDAKVSHTVKKTASPIPPTEVAPTESVKSSGQEKEPIRTIRASSLPTPEVKAEDLGIPDLRVPKTSTESPPLIPISADVERDMRALVGQDIHSVEALEVVVRTGFIPKVVGAIILYAVELEASDIHVQASGDQLLIRYRLDGILKDIIKMPGSLQAPIISRIKILARLKIDEARVPQDGRFDISVGARAIDLRISTFPTVYGEKVVIRLLDKSTGLLQFTQLGMAGSRLERIKAQIHKPYGVILATGPTGSGKSTLLYAILAEIATPEVNVVTLEDPVEYEMPGISQAQIQPKIGFGFAEGLRSILRQDPNIIMVGEIRDLETASMVTHAALTGHLVLSTLHTNDAAGALPRLINMGVEPFLITSAMNAIVAQRLVRRLCATCRTPWDPPTEIKEDLKAKLMRGNLPELTEIGSGELKLWKAKGCDACHDGYRGRVGLFEVLVMSEKIEALAVRKAPSSEISEAAIQEGMVTMEQDGIVKATEGLTTLDEVLRVTKTE